MWPVKSQFESAPTAEQRHAVGIKASVVGIVLNTLLCAGKAAIGAVAGSISIVADALNNLSDAAANIISLLGFKLAGKPADIDHPYGHGRFEYLASLSVALLVFLVGFELAKSSIDKLLHPSPVEFSWALVLVLVLSMAVKCWMAVFNSRTGEDIDSGTLKAAAVDSRNDVLMTGVVLVGALISHFAGVELDAILGLGLAAFILWSAYGLLKETIDPLLGRPADPELVTHISEKAMSYEGILGIHDLMVHDYGPGSVFASVHCEVAAEVDVLESHELIDRIEAAFRDEDNMCVTIHLDPIVTSDPHVAELRSWIAADVKEIDERLSIHDLRIVPGEHNTNVIFDVFAPYDVPQTDEDLKATIAARVREQFPHHTCVILVDHI